MLIGAVALGLFLNSSLASGAIGSISASDYHSLTFSPNDPNVIFFGYHNGLMRSNDGGRTWQSVMDKANFDAMGAGIGGSNPSQFYIAGHNVFQVSSDGGSTWQAMPTTGLPSTDFHGFAMSPGNPKQMYMYIASSGLFGSADSGQNWQQINTQLPGDIMSLSAGKGNPSVLYATSMGSGLTSSTDGGKSWNNSSLGGVVAVAADPTSAGTVYASARDGLYKSTNSGTSWNKLPFVGSNVILIGVSPAKPGVVEVVGIKGRQGMVYRSEDGGNTWK